MIAASSPATIAPSSVVMRGLSLGLRSWPKLTEAGAVSAERIDRAAASAATFPSSVAISVAPLDSARSAR